MINFFKKINKEYVGINELKAVNLLLIIENCDDLDRRTPHNRLK